MNAPSLDGTFHFCGFKFVLLTVEVTEVSLLFSLLFIVRYVRLWHITHIKKLLALQATLALQGHGVDQKPKTSHILSLQAAF